MKDLNREMAGYAMSVLEGIGGSAVVLFMDALKDWDLWRELPGRERLVLITQKEEAYGCIEKDEAGIKAAVKLPPVSLTRLGGIKLATISCLTSGVISSSDRVVYLTGVAGSGVLDTVVALDLASESELMATRGISVDLLQKIRPEVMDMVLNIALELASEGREERPVGTTFVIGDNERVSKLSRPLIMNPFKGYPESSRNILDESVHETVKEFSLLDGAFIIHENGVVMAAGVHLDAALKEEGLLPGLGSRHMAAAGITDVTDALAITISGSTGMVRMFKAGKVILELERPARGGGAR